MLRAIRAEFAKLKRARVPLWTAAAVCLFPLLSVMAIRLTDGAPRATWTAFMLFGPRMIASAYGVMLFGLAAAYLFGREFTEGTEKNMLTLPVRREAFVAAKLVVLAVWVGALALLAVAAQALYAALLGLDGFAWAGLAETLEQSLQVALMIYLTLPVVAWLSMIGRGYLTPMVFSALIASAGMVVAEVGWGRWFPWSMPIAVTGSVFMPPTAGVPGLSPASWAIAAGVFALGLAATFAYVDRVDNTQ
jgi:ABC-2 type transport system permease protein